MDAYPKNTKEFEARFRDEESCLRYILGIRWPEGYECPFCHSKRKSWLKSGGKLKCGDCGKSFSITSGTVFQDSHTPLTVWFRIMWHLCLQKNGLSALGLQRSLGLGTYKTAWLCLHKLRKAMVRRGREKLSGSIEADEAYIGGEREGKRGRGADGKILVFVAVEDRSYKDEETKRFHRLLGRIRLQVISDASSHSLEEAVKDNIQTGSTVTTDGWRGYGFLESPNYTRKIQVAKQEIRTDANDENPFGEMEHKIGFDSHLPCCHLVISLLKRWILGTLQGSLGKEHAQDYLNEFVFRFNRRNSKSRGMLFWRLVQLSIDSGPTTLKQIIPPHI